MPRLCEHGAVNTRILQPSYFSAGINDLQVLIVSQKLHQLFAHCLSWLNCDHLRPALKKLCGQFSRSRTDIRDGDFRGLLPRKNRIDRLVRVAWANSTIGICRVLKGIGHE